MSGEGRRLLDALTVRLVRILSHVFFRSIEVEGRQHLPRQGPVVYLSNHGNSLVDPMLLLAVLPPPVRFLAKSTLWDHGVVHWFVRLAGAIPIYRASDPGVDRRRNVESFARCWEELAAGAAIAIFPEGTSHEEPRLQPLKTGAARIALGAEQRHGPLGVCLVPVGLVFEDRTRFRSRALVRIGRPLVATGTVGTRRGGEDGLEAATSAGEVPTAAGPPLDDPNAVRALTAALDEALHQVTLNYDSWERARLVEHAVDVYLHAELAAPTRGTMAARFDARQAFAAAWDELAAGHPQEVAAAAAAVERYERLLAVSGLRDDQVAALYRPSLVARFLVRTLALLLLRLPLAALGVVLNWLPYRLPGWITRLLRRPPSEQATHKIVGGLLLFPLFWAAEAALAWSRLGIAGGAAMLVLAPLSGLAALDAAEHSRQLVTEARAYFLLRTGSRVARELRVRRAAVRERLAQLVELYRGGPASSARPS